MSAEKTRLNPLGKKLFILVDLFYYIVVYIQIELSFLPFVFLIVNELN